MGPPSRFDVLEARSGPNLVRLSFLILRYVVTYISTVPFRKITFPDIAFRPLEKVINLAGGLRICRQVARWFVCNHMNNKKVK